MIKIHKAIGQTISPDEFCKLVANALGQKPGMVHACFDIMCDELGQVEAMEVYCETVGIETY